MVKAKHILLALLFIMGTRVEANEYLFQYKLPPIDDKAPGVSMTPSTQFICLAQGVDSAEIYYRRGLEFIAAKNYDMAVEQFMRSTKLSFQNTKYRGALADAWLVKGSLDDAIKELKLCVSLEIANLSGILENDDVLKSFQRHLANLEIAYKRKNDSKNNRDAGNFFLSTAKFLIGLTQNTLATEMSKRARGFAPNDAVIRRGLADCFLQNAMLDSAIQEYRVAVQLSPHDAMVHWSLGKTLVEHGRILEGIPEIQEAVRLDSLDAQKRLALARTYALSGMSYQALNEYLIAVRLDSNYVDGLEDVVSLLAQRGQHDSLSLNLLLKLQLNPMSSETHKVLGDAYRDNGMHDEAIKEYHQAIELRPDYEDAHAYLGAEYLQQGSIDEAIEELGKAIEIDSTDAWNHKFLGDAYFRQETYDQAIEEYRHAIALQQDYAEAFFRLGLVYLRLERFAEAISALVDACRIDPMKVWHYKTLADAYRENKMYVQAIKAYERAIALQPDYADAFVNLGWSYNLQRQYKDAIKHLARAVEINSLDLQAYSNLCLSHFCLKQYAEAEQALQHAQQVAGDTRTVLNFIAYTLVQSKSFAEARNFAKTFIQADSSRINFLIAIGNFSLANQEYKDVEKTIQEVLKSNPKSSEAYALLGQAYYDQKLYEKAIKAFGKSIAIDSTNSAVHMMLASAYHEGEDPDFKEAYEHTEIALEMEPNDLSYKSNFVENNFTTERFQQAYRLGNAVIADSRADSSTTLVMRTFTTAALLFQDDHTGAKREFQRFSAAFDCLPTGFKSAWIFNGTLHFVRENIKISAEKKAIVTAMINLLNTEKSLQSIEWFLAALPNEYRKIATSTIFQK